MSLSTTNKTIPAESKHCTFSFLSIDMAELYLLMGYGEQKPDEGIQVIIDELISELKTIVTPEYGYAIHPGGRKDKNHLWIGDKTINTGGLITSTLREADHFALFAASIGKGFDDYMQELYQVGDIVKAFIGDSLGSVLVEATVSVMIAELEQKAESMGMQISNSYSPGYCDWPLSEQKNIFSFFPSDFCGIRLTSSCLMVPMKSVSGIIGVGEKVRKRAYSCEICNMESCMKNKKKKQQV